LKNYNIIIIGAGPIGLACGIEAEKRNISYLIHEKGCLVNSLFHYPTNMVYFSTSDRLEIGDVPFVSHGDKPTRRESLEYYRRVADSWKLKINTYEKVEVIEQSGNEFKVITNKEIYSADKIIIATGARPRSVSAIPVDKKNIITSTEAMILEKLPEELIIIGAGAIGVEFAYFYSVLGTKVTIIEMMKNILQRLSQSLALLMPAQ